MDLTGIIAAVITGLVTLCGVIITNQKTSAVIQEQIKQLRHEVEKHNSVVERVYKLEEHSDRTDGRLTRLEENITYLERR